MWTEKHFREHWHCCEVDEGGPQCCCESTEHNKKSIEHVLKESTQDGVRVELIFRTEKAAEKFYFKLGMGEYRR